MVISSIRELSWPLWNSTMYSGYPLMANFQSGLLNILNIFPLIFGMVKGWGLLMWGQVLGSSLTMYWLLRRYKYTYAACIVGAVVYAFAGFPIVWMEYATVGQAMIWIPLVILSIESASFFWLPLLFLFIVGAGHFQALVYTAAVAVCYFIYQYIGSLRQHLPKFAIASMLSLGLCAMQLLPTLELTSLGIRFGENYVKNFNFGLAPIHQLITLLVPDFFGNPVTNNYWGAFNYENVVYYAGILSAISLVYFMFNWKNARGARFFVVAAIIALLIGFDTPIGKSIYLFHIPGLSTSVAGRIGVIFTLAVAILTGAFVNEIDKLDKKSLYKSIIFWTVFLFLYGGILFGSRLEFLRSEYGTLFQQDAVHMMVGLRNNVIPIGIYFLFSALLIFFRKYKVTKWLIILLTVVELFRFGWKYTTFSPANFVYPQTSAINFLTDQKDIFRVEREQAEIMPPNTWAAYGLQSPSGYDPMSVASYVKQYNFDFNKDNNPGVSRYTESAYFDAEVMGKYNVKYLLAIKRNNEAIVPGENINYKIDERVWKRVFQTPAVAVLENTKYKERARVVDSEGSEATGLATIESYQSNKVVIKFDNIDGEKLLLADTFYPGWKAMINGNATKIGDEIKPFRTVDIRGIKEGEIIFEYKPNSFRIGLYLSIASLFIWIVTIFLVKKK